MVATQAFPSEQKDNDETDSEDDLLIPNESTSKDHKKTDDEVESKQKNNADETDSREVLIPNKKPQQITDFEPTQAYDMDKEAETDSEDEDLLGPPKAPKRMSDFEPTQAYDTAGDEVMPPHGVQEASNKSPGKMQRSEKLSGKTEAEKSPSKQQASDLEATQAYDMGVEDDSDDESALQPKTNTDMMETQAYEDGDKVK